MTFDLPLPPSTNSLFATDWRTKKRFTSKAYAAWKKVAADALGAQYAAMGSPSVHRPVEVRLQVNINYTGDVLNREKAVTDLLVDQLDMPDDRYIERYVIERDRSVEGVRVTIEGSATDGPRPFGEIAARVVKRIGETME